MMDSKGQDPAGLAEARRSIWQASADDQLHSPLAEDVEVDVAIVGGGITGITTAALLAQQGLTVAVLEAERVGSGTTGHSTGNLYAPVDQYLHKLVAKWGQETVTKVVQSRRLAVDLIEQHVRDYRLQCNFGRQPWVLYATDAETADKLIEHEYQAAVKAGLSARVTGDLPLPFEVERALVVSDQAQFDPLRYVRQLAAAIRSERCRIHERTPVIDVDEDRSVLKTSRHLVKARHIVLATHTPKGVSPLHTELAPYREYAVAAPLLQSQLAGGIFWSVGGERHSTRLAVLDGKPYVLMIGGKYKTGHLEDSEAAYRRLEASLQARFDIGEVAFRWSAQQYRPADGLPYIGQSIGSAHVHFATGFAADGLTYGTLAAIMLRDQITGQPNAFSELYTPRRFTPVKSATTFLKENLNVAGHYVRDFIKNAPVAPLADIARGEGRVLEIDGEKVAVFRDEAAALHAVSPVCTHMKCLVHWNQAERSWDCPCHGSRFSVEGKVLEGPASLPLARVSLPAQKGAGA